jgi:hypothetical protein
LQRLTGEEISYQVADDGQLVVRQQLALLLQQLRLRKRFSVAPRVLLRRKLLEGVADPAPADAVGLLNGEVVLDLEVLLPPRRQKDGHVVAVVLSFFAVWEDLQLEVEVLGLSSVGFNLIIVHGYVNCVILGAGNTKRGSTSVPLTSCSTALESAV